MEVKINKLAGVQIELKIELPVDEFSRFIAKATSKLGKDLEVEGFRKGKLPEEVAKKKIGEPNILVEAADLAIKENYQRAILENKIEAISHPEIDILKLAPGNPFIFRAKLSVLPELRLPDYKNITAKIKRKKVSVEEKEVDAAFKWLQKSRAKFTIKNGSAQKGDFVEIEYWSPELVDSLNSKGQKDAFILGEGHFVPGFEEELIGMKTGQEKQGILLTIPENHPFKKNVRQGN